jgi:hypothetical protein
MRIAYVSLHWPRTMSSGVGKKINRHIEAWRNAGHEVGFFMHTTSHETGEILVPGETFLYRGNGRMAFEWRRVIAAQRLLQAVRRYEPSIIYLRYGMYVYPIHRLAGIAPLIEELNTNDLGQHARLGPIYSVYNRWTRGLLIHRASGLICMSDELAHNPSNAVYRKPTLILGDGIDLTNISQLPGPNNDKPHLAFIGSPDSPWQGVDKLAQLASRFPDLTVHVIGYEKIDEQSILPNNLKLHGYLDKARYIKILAMADCAISSLALHRIQLAESSPLKTRECLAYGLPMVLPYKDTDLDGAGFDFLLKIPNKEDNIQTHGEAIREFAYRMRGKRANRKMLERLIGSEQKEIMRLKFFEEILQGRTGSR